MHSPQAGNTSIEQFWNGSAERPLHSTPACCSSHRPHRCQALRATALPLCQSPYDAEQLGHQGEVMRRQRHTGPEQGHPAGSAAAGDGSHAQGLRHPETPELSFKPRLSPGSSSYGGDSIAEARPHLVCCRAAPCTGSPVLAALLLAGPPRPARLPGTLAGPAGTTARAPGGCFAEGPIQRGLRWVEARERGDSGGGSGGRVPAEQSRVPSVSNLQAQLPGGPCSKVVLHLGQFECADSLQQTAQTWTRPAAGRLEDKSIVQPCPSKLSCGAGSHTIPKPGACAGSSQGDRE